LIVRVYNDTVREKETLSYITTLTME